MNEKLKAGARLQILNEPEQEYYMTSIREVDRENITISEPVSGGKNLHMPQYSTWQFCLLGDDAAYFFTSRVVVSKHDQGGVSLTIRRPDSIQRRQRRGHVRVPCHQNILYWSLDDPAVARVKTPLPSAGANSLWEDPQWIRDFVADLEQHAPGRAAFTIDMSGGGLRKVTLEALKRHERLLLKIDLEEQRNKRILLLEARVIRVVPLNIGGWKRYRVGLCFVNIDEKTQEAIISFLFKAMRKKI